MSVIAAIYSVVQLLLKAIGLWESFLSYSDAQRTAEAAAKQAALNKAVDDSKTATDESQIWKDQDEISKNLP